MSMEELWESCAGKDASYGQIEFSVNGCMLIGETVRIDMLEPSWKQQSRPNPVSVSGASCVGLEGHKLFLCLSVDVFLHRFPW